MAKNRYKQVKKVFSISLGARCREFESPISDQNALMKDAIQKTPHFCAAFSLSRNLVCTQEQTGSRTYMSEKTAKRNEDNRFLHFHVANFFKFMAANLSFTQFVT